MELIETGADAQERMEVASLAELNNGKTAITYAVPLEWLTSSAWDWHLRVYPKGIFALRSGGKFRKEPHNYFPKVLRYSGVQYLQWRDYESDGHKPTSLPASSRLFGVTALLICVGMPWQSHGHPRGRRNPRGAHWDVGQFEDVENNRV